MSNFYEAFFKKKKMRLFFNIHSEIICKWPQTSWQTVVPPKSGILQGPHPSANISPAWKQEETYLRKPSYGGWTSHVHAPGVHHYRWHGTWVSSLIHKRLAELLSVKKGEDYSTTMSWIRTSLICHSENIPPMLKGIAFTEESKSQHQWDGLWHWKRNCRTLGFDIQ